MKRDLFKVMCMLLIIFVQPLYSHPQNIKLSYKPSFEVVGARQIHAIDTPPFSHQLVTKRQARDATANEQLYCQIQDRDATCSSGYLQLALSQLCSRLFYSFILKLLPIIPWTHTYCSFSPDNYSNFKRYKRHKKRNIRMQHD